MKKQVQRMTVALALSLLSSSLNKVLSCSLLLLGRAAGMQARGKSLGFAQPSQMTAHTKKDLTLCHNCPLTLWPANRTRLPPAPPLYPTPPSSAPPFPLTPAACIKDPSEVSLATFTSEREPIMERLGRRILRQRGTHRCGGGEEGAASHCCPLEGTGGGAGEAWKRRRGSGEVVEAQWLFTPNL